MVMVRSVSRGGIVVSVVMEVHDCPCRFIHDFDYLLVG